MKSIKKFLYLILSEFGYLKMMHRGFFVLYRLGWLKKDARFKYHYMIQNIVEQDDVVLDIGANLGYFSKTFAELTPKGKLISIEPIPLFYKVLSKFLKKYPQVTIYNVALGQENGTVAMALPETNGMMRTGLPHVVESASEHKTQQVNIVKGTELLNDLDRLDYIKCDIEGFEKIVMEEIKPILEKFQPYIQIELAEKNQEAMIHFYNELGYTQFGISKNQFIEEKGNQAEEGDFFFVPKSKLDQFKKKFNLA